jgi:hypothetical protein
MGGPEADIVQLPKDLMQITREEISLFKLQLEK